MRLAVTVRPALRVLRPILCTCALAVGGSFAEAGMIYDAVNDFSLSSNPNGAWSYGTLTTTGQDFSGTFVANTTALSDVDFPGSQMWTNNQGVPYSAAVEKNNSNSTQFYATTIALPVDLLRMDGESYVGVTRWTSPAAGVADITGLFQIIDSQSSGVIGNVLLNGQSLFASNNMTAFGDQAPFSLTGVSLQAGDVIDFAEGAGAFFDASTGLKVSIDFTAAVPEPGSLALCLTALGTTGFLYRRKRPSALKQA